ncbi:MAG: hypothetical protein ACTSO7_10585 [Candidatus Heimdallarchaeota archaeon]
MIKRVLILKNGVPLINRNYEPGGEQDQGATLGQYQGIVDTVSNKAMIGQPAEEVIDGKKITYSLSPNLIYIISSDLSDTGVLEIFIPELSTLFSAVFPDDYISTWTGEDASVFKGFESKLDQVRSAFENRIITKPGSRRVLDTLSIMELPQRLQKTGLTILDAKIASFEEVISLTGVTPQETVANVQEILNAGFLYTTKVGNKVFYSVKSFDESQAGSAATPPTKPIAPVTTSTTTRTDAVATTPSTTPVSTEAKMRDLNKGNMPFLIKQLKKDVDKIFDAIMNRKLLLILLDPKSDKNEVLLNMLLDTFQCFAPDRELRIVNFATDFVHPRDADIIRVDRDLLQFYSNEIVLDMDHKKISNGESSIYLADIIKDMSKLKHNECVSLLINRTTLIDKLAQDWAKIKKLNLPTEDFISGVRAKHNPAIIQIMSKLAENVYMGNG